MMLSPILGRRESGLDHPGNPDLAGAGPGDSNPIMIGPADGEHERDFDPLATQPLFIPTKRAVRPRGAIVTTRRIVSPLSVVIT
jgi:hypothetical protein